MRLYILIEEHGSDNINDRRQALIIYSEINQFDPLIPTNWYSLPQTGFKELKVKHSPFCSLLSDFLAPFFYCY